MIVEIKDHAIKRIMSDRFFETRPKNENEAIQLITKAIKFSKLLKLNTDGTELRGHNGKIYVCARDLGKITVITVLRGNRFVR